MFRSRGWIALGTSIVGLSLGYQDRVCAQEGKTAKGAGATVEKAGSQAVLAPRKALELLGEARKTVLKLAEEEAKNEGQLRPPDPFTMFFGFNREVQGNVLVQIGKAQARLGDMKAARETWQAALDAGSAIESVGSTDDRAELLIGLAEAQLAAGDKEEARLNVRQALQQTRAIPARRPFFLEPPPMFAGETPQSKKIGLLTRIARLQSECGEAPRVAETLDQAGKAADSIKDPGARIAALVELAEKAIADRAETFWTRALDLALAQEEYIRAQGVERILRGRVRAGQIGRAVETVSNRLQGDLATYGVWVLADSIAGGEMPVDKAAMAKLASLTQKAAYDRHLKRFMVFRRLAQAQARLGDYEAAYRTCGEPQPLNNIQSFRSTQDRVYVMTAIARAQIKGKQLKDARNTAQAALELIAPMAAEDAEAYFPFEDLGDILARAGDMAGAMTVANGITAAHSRVAILSSLAVTQFQQGKPDEARKSMEQAVKVSAEAPNEAIWNTAGNGSGTTALNLDPMLAVNAKIAEARARIGEVDAALKLLASVRESRFKGIATLEAVQEVVKIRLEADDVPGALKALELLNASDPMVGDDRIDLHEKVAVHQAQKHEPRTVLEWVSREKSPLAKLQLCRGLAEGLAKRCDPQKPGKEPAAAQSPSNAAASP